MSLRRPSAGLSSMALAECLEGGVSLPACAGAERINLQSATWAVRPRGPRAPWPCLCQRLPRWAMLPVAHAASLLQVWGRDSTERVMRIYTISRFSPAHRARRAVCSGG